MLWIAVWSVLAAIAVIGLVASTNSARFARRVAREGGALLAQGEQAVRSSPRALDGLPEPVSRYLRQAIAHGRAPVRSLRLRHRGTIRMKPDAAWLPLRGAQFFRAAPPSFVWWGRIRLAPGAWIDAHDELVDGVAQMRIIAESTFPLGESHGTELDHGAAIRVLGEMMWFPTAFLDERFVIWSPIDGASALATLRIRDVTVEATFRFGHDGFPTRIDAVRYRDVGDGKTVLTPWSGLPGDFRSVAGMRIPFEMDAIWKLETGPFHCLHFVVESIEHDPKDPVGDNEPSLVPVMM